jgi:hypothetical protein
VRRVIRLSLILISLISIITIFTVHYLASLERNGPSSGEVITIKNATPKFSTYENVIYGISIDYPSFWQRVDFDRDNLIANFVSNSSNESGLLENVALQVIGIPYHNKTTLKDIITEEISTYKSGVPGFHLLSTGLNDTHSGIPTYKLEFLHTNGQLQIRTLEILAINKNEGYKIIFSADRPEYGNWLPIVEKMVDSFNFKYSQKGLETTPI